MGWEHVQIQKPESGLAAGDVLLYFRSTAEVPLGKVPKHASLRVTDSDTSLWMIAWACAICAYNIVHNHVL